MKPRSDQRPAGPPARAESAPPLPSSGGAPDSFEERLRRLERAEHNLAARASLAAQAAEEPSRRQAALLAKQERKLQRARETRDLMESGACRIRKANAAAEQAKKASKESRKAARAGHDTGKEERPHKRRREASSTRKRERTRTPGFTTSGMSDQASFEPRSEPGPKPFEIPGLGDSYNDGEMPGRRANVLGLATPKFHTKDLVEWMAGQISAATATLTPPLSKRSPVPTVLVPRLLAPLV